MQRESDSERIKRQQKKTKNWWTYFRWCGVNVSNDWVINWIQVFFVFVNFLFVFFSSSQLFNFHKNKNEKHVKMKSLNYFRGFDSMYVQHHANLRTWHWLSHYYITLSILHRFDLDKEKKIKGRNQSLNFSSSSFFFFFLLIFIFFLYHFFSSFPFINGFYKFFYSLFLSCFCRYNAVA